MTLTEYVKSYPRSMRMTIRRYIANVLGVSEVYVRNMCNGNKKIPGHYALKIEHATHGSVLRYESCPTLYPPNEYYVAKEKEPETQ